MGVVGRAELAALIERGIAGPEGEELGRYWTRTTRETRWGLRLLVVSFLALRGLIVKGLVGYDGSVRFPHTNRFYR